MAEGNFTNEKIIFSPEKQKELFDVISVVFSEELKTSNCFILPAVGQKAGTAMREKGFEKANKATFLAAPEYFILGYNEKNVDAISLVGYPEDPNFSTSPNADFVPTSKQNSVQLNNEQQKKLAEIFVKFFKDHNKGGKVYLSSIGLKAGKAISEAGLGRVSIELFKGASDYFSFSQDAKGAYIIFLKEGCGVVMPAKTTKAPVIKKPTFEKKTPSKEKKQFEDIILDRLKKTYKTNEVSASNILIFLRNNKIVIPETISSFERLIELLVAKFGGVIRDNGEGTSQEQYVTLRKTLPVPQSVCERVELIVAEFFLDRDLIPNVDIGQALKSNGIDFKEYNYADLTAFLRSFTNIFTIVAQPAANNRFQIFVRIIPSFKEKYANVDFERENPEQILQMQFEKVVCDMFAAEKYDAIIEQAILREAIKHSNRDMWECIIRAYLIVNGALLEDVPTLTDWEKEAIDFKHLTANVTDEFLSSFSFGKEEVANIKQYVLDYTHKTVNYSTLAQRLQTLCGKESYLVGVVLNLGLIARIQSDKAFCFRLLMLYYARNESEKMWGLWDSFAETCLNPSSIIMIVGTLFAERKFEFVLEVTEKYNSMYSQIEVVQLYAEYAKILLCGTNGTLPGLMTLERRRSAELVIAFLEHTKKENNVLLYTAMLFNCITMQTEFVPLSSLRILLGEHAAYLNEIYPILIDSAGRNEKKSIIVLRQLILEGFAQPCDQWENINKTLLDEYKLKSCSDENRENILYEAIELFPTESLFVDELVSVIKKTGCGDDDNLEGFIDNLIDSKNYDQVIMLYEHDSSLEIRDKSWFLRKLSYCYQQRQEPKKSLDVEMSIISSMLDEGEEIHDCLTQLITILYDGFVSRTLISLDEETALRVYHLFDHYKCEQIMAHKYWIAIMGLALCAKNIPLLSLFYCLSEGISNEAAFIEICEDEIQETELGYKYRVGDLQKTFEYVLTQEKPEGFFTILAKAANVIRTNADEKLYFKYRDSASSEKVEPEKIITLIISEFNRERAWKLLSEYAYKSKKVTLNFVANCVWFFKFKDTSYALSNSTKALEYHVDNSLPRNMLWCSLSIWKSNMGRPVDGYKNAFLNHIRRCKSFQDANTVVVDEWYNMFRSMKKPELIDFMVATEMAKQTATFGVLYRMVFKEDTAYKMLVNQDVATFIRFCSAFVYCSDDESFHEALVDIRELRNQIGSFSKAKNDRSALVWIDDLIDKRNQYISDDYFVEASMAVLSSYPEAPSNDIVSKWITPDFSHRLPNYALLRNWIDTFGNMRTVNQADYAIRNYISKNYLSEDDEERENFFKIRLFLAEKYIVFFDRLHPNTNDDYLRRCKTYYGLRKIANISTPIPADFREKMHKDLEHFGILDAYLNYETGVDIFSETVKDDYIRERFIYCGITNYWDRVLDRCLTYSEEIVPNIDAIEDYFNVIDYRPIRRRLLQMYVYASSADMLLKNETIVSEWVSRLKDVRYYYNHISSGDIILSEYLASVSKLTEILQPSLVVLIKKIEDAVTDEEKIRVVEGIIFVLSNKDLKQFRAKVEDIEEDDLHNIVLPTLTAIQHSNDVSSMILQMVLNDEAIAEVMLNSTHLVSAIGNYTANLFKSVICIKHNDFDKAAEFLAQAGARENTHELLYDKLADAIENKTQLDMSGDFSSVIHRDDTLPRMTYMKSSDSSGMGLHQLVSDFYAENLYDAKGKCLLASKILFLIEEGVAYNDTINLIFDWGFVEIEATYDIEKKATILFEMLDNIDKLKDIKGFKERFVRNFLYILQEFDFVTLIKKFKRIFDCHMILYRRFSPYDNCDCYAQAIIMLRDLYNLDKENVDPNAAMTEVNDIKSKILALHIKYPQNRFVSKCIDYVDRFVQQIFERGVFEVSILNVDRLYDGVIYYQVKNNGYELISNIALTFAIDGVEKSIEQVRIDSIIPEGLRPNQVYAGEYVPGIDVTDGTEIGCSITVEYSVSDEEGQEVFKNYVAVDSNTGGKLLAHANTNSVYQKDGRAGYSEEPIKQESNFIGRKKELNRIMGKLLKGQNVLLFGTNGTGKSSILYNIRKVCLPEAYADESLHLGKHHAAELKFDTDCTERNVLESIVNVVSGATLFRVFVKRNGTEETQDILAMAAEEWAHNVNKIFDENGMCTNTDAVRQYFVTLDEALSLSNLDLYILIDQFERVISSKNIDSKHMLFLRDLTCQNIRFIMAGSNYLLEEVSVDKINNQQENSWSDIFSRGFEKEKIGNMDQEDFELLITQKSALNDGAMQYTPEALEYLWQFTKGHAFYSCLLGNRTLDIMSSRKVKRNVIYPSDIFIAIYQPGKYLPNEKSNKEKETAIKDQIFQDIIDNTPIKFVGRTLARMQSSGERRVSYQKLKDYIEHYRPDILDDFADALSVLVARDFITYDEIDIQHQSDRSKDDDRKTAREYFFTSDLYLEHFATVYVPELSTKEREEIENKNQSIDDLVTDLRTRKFSAEDIGKVRDALKEFGTNGPTTVIHTDTLVGTNTGTVNSIGTQNIVNIQNMANTFNQILAGVTEDQLLSSLADLPRLNTYFGDRDVPLLKNLESDNSVVVAEAEAKLESTTSQMVSEYLSALVSNNDTPEEFCAWDMLKITRDKYLLLSEEINPSFMAELFFAAKLDYIFSLAKTEEAELDFSPVCIMYCKTLEKVLRAYHTEKYSTFFPLESCYKKGDTNYSFGDLKTMKKKKKAEIQGQIQLGSFLWPIKPGNYNRETDWINIPSSKRDNWEEHGKMLKNIVPIRNKSAHGNSNGNIVRYDQLDRLKTLLFTEDGILTIVRLSK